MNKLHRHRILALDDDVTLGGVLKSYLEDSGPFLVDQILEGRDLLPQLAVSSYDLMLLDFHLSDATGLDVLSLLRTNGHKLPVIMMTGKGDERTAAEAIKLGASEYMIKDENFWSELPLLIQKTIRMHELQEAVSRSAEELRKSEERFRTLFETMSLGVVYFDRLGNIVSANPAAMRILGFSSGQASGRTLNVQELKAVHENGAPFTAETLPPLLAINRGEPVLDMVLGIPHIKTGNQVWIKMDANPQFIPGEGNPYQVYSTFEDISKQKRAQDILHSRLRLMQFAGSHSLFELLQASLFEICEQTSSLIGTFFFYNESRQSLILQAFSTGNIEDVTDTSGTNLHYNIYEVGAWTECIDEMRPVINNFETGLSRPYTLPSGQNRITRQLLVPVFRGGQIVAVVDIANKLSDYTEADVEIVSLLADFAWDIAERKQKEEALRISEERHNVQLMQAARLSAIGQLATGVAHQISNPLTVILGEAQLLLQILPKEDQLRESIQTIEKAGWRAQWAVQVLNTFSEPAPETMESVDLFESIKLAVGLVGTNLEADGVAVVVSLDGEPQHVQGNLRQIESLWVNLLLYIRRIINLKPCSLNLSSSDPGNGTVTIEIQLDGVSTPETYLEDVFNSDLVFNPDSAISGMEYSICQEIVRQNHGAIEVTVGENQTNFRVTLLKEAL